MGIADSTRLTLEKQRLLGAKGKVSYSDTILKLYSELVS